MQFDDQFFNDIGMAEASAEAKAQLTEKVAELVQTRLSQRLSEVLSDEQAEHFSALIDAGQENEAFNYLESSYPQYQQLVAAEIDRAKQELSADVAAARQQLGQ